MNNDYKNEKKILGVYRLIMFDLSSENYPEEYRIYSFRKAVKQFFLSPEVQQIVFYRVSRYLALNLWHKRFLWLIPALFFSLSRVITGTDISPFAEIAPGLTFVHGMGVVIGGGVKIGKNAKILNDITIGRGHSDKRGDGFPVLGDNVSLGAGARILGPVTIGDNVIVGANSVVIDSFPSDVTIAGVPAKIIRDHNGKL